VRNQKVREEEHTDIVLEDDGGRLLSLHIVDDEIRSLSGGPIMVERGNGERVQVFEPLRLFMAIWDAAYAAGQRSGRAE
jgi:hypothetical protein